MISRPKTCPADIPSCYDPAPASRRARDMIDRRAEQLAGVLWPLSSRAASPYLRIEASA